MVIYIEPVSRVVGRLEAEHLAHFDALAPRVHPKLRQMQPEAIAFCSIILAYAAYNSANTKWGDGFQGMKFQLLGSIRDIQSTIKQIIVEPGEFYDPCIRF